jgi:hypothetical protein
MKHITTFAALAAFALAAPVVAADQTETLEIVMQDATDVDLSDFIWIKRPIVVFADTPADPRFDEQLELLKSRPEALIERDVVIITDTNSAELSPLRKKLRPRGFMLVLIGKDGDVKLRKPTPWNVREITRIIDKMPMRQREIREGRSTGG